MHTQQSNPYEGITFYPALGKFEATANRVLRRGWKPRVIGCYDSLQEAVLARRNFINRVSLSEETREAA